ncbi:uncharacterized protein LOC130277377 [Hyla sarda]|uniref:uncharacterized protein LOC130277377 n=1 Tax=Hyla sarda TaxID=327740 RepID=UPI0024C3898C|nr:uncharacterized protein LOC130277377 [Hyla sarda]
MRGKRKASKDLGAEEDVEQQTPAIKLRKMEESNLGETSRTKTSQDEDKLSPKEKLKDFTFHRELGSGNYGKVLLASHAAHKAKVAVKIASKKKIIEEEPESATLERRVLEMVEASPFFTHLHQSFHTKELLYYILEYIGGGSLKDKLESTGKCDEETVKFYAAELISGISYLHSKRVIHRDLKPENILINNDGHLKIADFGLSTILEKNANSAQGYAGTLEYMAPEMVSNKKYSFGVDWWSCGVILYELATRMLPFQAKTPAALKRKILKSHVSYPGDMNPELKDLIQQLLKRDPNRRLNENNIRHHELFRDVNWTQVDACRLHPPNHPCQMSLEEEATSNEILLPEETNLPGISSNEQKFFKGFSYTSAAWKT